MLGHLSAPAELARGDERFPRGARSGARKLTLAATGVAAERKMLYNVSNLLYIHCK
jgi:hypothetical protein